jgi:hypothetical protein
VPLVDHRPVNGVGLAGAFDVSSGMRSKIVSGSLLAQALMQA